MVSLAMATTTPLKLTVANTMPPARAGDKHGLEPGTPTLASVSKKRVRFASTGDAAAKKELERQSDDDDSNTAGDKTKRRLGNASAKSMFKKFVVNALDERALVFPPSPLPLMVG
jgi:hypothetical protein